MNNLFNLYVYNSVLIILINLMMILISVAFLTLLERKILGYIQLRKGLNKVSLLGLIQLFADAIKLFIKEVSMIYKSNYFMYLVSLMLMIFLMMSLWLIMLIFFKIYSMNLGLIYLMSVLGLGVYMMMISGWSSNSLYSLIGALRSIAQTISYEVSMIMILINFLLLIESYSLINLFVFQSKILFLFILFLVMLMMFVSILAELNRTLFDFAEGESELVSGFNVEYMSGSFAMIFIAEYGNILFMSFFLSILFLGGAFMNLEFYFYMGFILIMIIWVRSAFLRYRYDNLMYLTWKFYLTFSLLMLIFVVFIKLILF